MNYIEGYCKKKVFPLLSGLKLTGVAFGGGFNSD